MGLPRRSAPRNDVVWVPRNDVVWVPRNDVRQFFRSISYRRLCVCNNKNIHDRFLIVDDDVYHIGASLKDLGKKLFAFSRSEEHTSELQSL